MLFSELILLSSSCGPPGGGGGGAAEARGTIAVRPRAGPGFARSDAPPRGRDGASGAGRDNPALGSERAEACMVSEARGRRGGFLIFIHFTALLFLPDFCT